MTTKFLNNFFFYSFSFGIWIHLAIGGENKDSIQVSESIAELKSLIYSSEEVGLSVDKKNHAANIFQTLLPDVSSIKGKWEVNFIIDRVRGKRPNFLFTLREDGDSGKRLLYGSAELLEEPPNLTGLPEIEGFPALDLNNGNSMIIHPGRILLTIHSTSEQFGSISDLESFVGKFELEALSSL